MLSCPGEVSLPGRVCRSSKNDHRVPELLGERAESSSSLSCRVPTLAAATAAVLAAAAAAAPLSAGPPAEAPAAL